MIERQQSCICYCASDDGDSHWNDDDHHHHGYDGDAGDGFGFEDERWLWLPIKCRYVQLIEKNKGENWFSILSASKIWWYEIFWNYLEITLSFSLLVTTANHYWLSQLPPDCFWMVIMGTSKEDTGGFDKDGHELINFLGWFNSVGSFCHLVLIWSILDPLTWWRCLFRNAHLGWSETVHSNGSVKKSLVFIRACPYIRAFWQNRPYFCDFTRIFVI